MEDILASIKKVIAEEKELRTATRPVETERDDGQSAVDPENDILELNEPLAPPVDLGPPLVNDNAAGQSRQALEELQSVASTLPPPPSVNPLEEVVREMLRPMLKAWLDEHLAQMVQEHVRREITRITGRPL